MRPLLGGSAAFRTHLSRPPGCKDQGRGGASLGRTPNIGRPPPFLIKDNEVAGEGARGKKESASPTSIKKGTCKYLTGCKEL